MNKSDHCTIYFDSLEKKEHYQNIMRGLKASTGLNFGEIVYRAVLCLNCKKEDTKTKREV
jgi:hypothetical protein